MKKKQTEENGTAFAGMTFVITGSVEHFANRKELQALIESKGGKATGSVTSKTTYLINNDTQSSSSKNKKAKRAGDSDPFGRRFPETASGEGKGGRLICRLKYRRICLQGRSWNQKIYFMMDEDRAMSQDIRPLEILILNLMPLKEDTETQLLACAVQYTAAGGLYLSNAVYPCVQKHIGQPFKQVLCYL